MKLITALILATAMSVAVAGEEKNVKVDGKTYEVRVPKSAKIDCKDAKNADKTECKKQPKEMPKIESSKRRTKKEVILSTTPEPLMHSSRSGFL
jgi:hypothetical protein